MNAFAHGSGTASSREATENALLDALETALLDAGLRNLTVNAVVDTAGVAKPLLYRYFGDLSGLVRSWSRRRGFWAGVRGERPLPGPRSDGDDRQFRRRVGEELLATASYLRDHPVNLEFLAEELTAPSDLSEAFAEARDEQRRPFLEAMLKDPRYRRRDHRRVIIVLYAALVYLAMRSRRSPRFMGLRLDTDAGWNDALAMVREIAELLEGDSDTTPAVTTRTRKGRRATR
jgi:AcrR family transcriptional regulator